MSGFRNPAVDGPVRRDFERTGKSDIPNDIPPVGGGIKWPIYRGRARIAWAVIDEADLALVEPHLWRQHNAGYPWTYVDQHGTSMHRIIAGLTKEDPREVDHINGDKLDNRRCNLRVCTRAENAQNSPSRPGTSRYRGVSWNTRLRKWVAQGKVGGQVAYLGVFDDEQEAARVAAAWRAENLPLTNSARDVAPSLEEDTPQKEAA